MSDHHHHHGHHHGHDASARKLALASVLTGGFMLAELVGGLLSGSLALLADAGHMLTDFAALLLAFLALSFGKRPATGRLSYGYDRLSVLAAFVNGLALFVIAGWICIEAVERLRTPAPVLGGMMLWVAVLGFIVNLAVFAILTRGGGQNLNIRAAVLHVAGDLLGSLAAIVAAGVILATGWTPIDPILSVLVAAIILRSALAIVRESGHILLEGAPPGISCPEVAQRLPQEVNGLKAATHLHAWSVSEERPMMTMELTLTPGADAARVKSEIRAFLADHYGVDHVTLELRED